MSLLTFFVKLWMKDIKPRKTSSALLKGSSFRVIQTLISIGIGFWMLPFLITHLGSEDYALWVLIGGLLAYLFYGAGWLRPEEWLLDSPDVLAGRIAVAGLAFVFGMATLGLSRGRVKSEG